MAILRNDSVTSLEGLLCKLGDFLVGFKECRCTTSNCHIGGLSVESEICTDHLRCICSGHLHPTKAVLILLIETLHILEVSIPIPLLTSLFLDELNGITDFLCGILLNTIFRMAKGSCDLEGRNSSYFIGTGHNSVTHKGTITGGITLNCTCAINGHIVINSDTGFCCRHRADVTRHTHLLNNIQIVSYCRTVQKNRYVYCCGLPAYCLQSGEATHNGEHLVLIQDDTFPGELLIVTAVLVSTENICQKSSDILCNQVIFFMGDSQIITTKTCCVLINHGRYCQIVQHPTITEEALYIRGMHEESGQHLHNTEPSPVIIHGVLKSTPFSSFSNTSLGIEITETFASGHFTHITPPLSGSS